jgi:hypothetical protein
VDEKRPDLKAALRELAAEDAASLGPHAGLKRLIAYRRGTLAAADREALQEHLSLCKRCTERLRELRDFEAAAARGGVAGPEPLREEAWESLARRLPWQMSAVRPIAGTDHPRAPRQHRLRYFLSGVAAALLAVFGFVQLSRMEPAAGEAQRAFRKVTGLERQLDEREQELAAARRSLREAESRLAAERVHPERESERVRELETRVAELEKLRQTPQAAPERHDRIAAAQEIEFSVAPRFALRGQEPPASGVLLRGGGTVNPVLLQTDRATLALSLADQPVSKEYRFELEDQNGQVLWSGRRPGSSLLGDAGTSVSISGLKPGRYRLRVEGLQPDRTELLGEYVLEVARP